MRALVRVLVALLGVAFGLTTSAQSTADPSTKFVLTEQILDSNHHKEAFANALERQYKLSWSFCRDNACKADLEKAIDQVIPVIVEKHFNEYAEILATHLSESELRAALAFSQSPEGKAFGNAQLAASDELGALDHRSALASYQEISKIFCAKRKDVCTTKNDQTWRKPQE